MGELNRVAAVVALLVLAGCTARQTAAPAIQRETTPEESTAALNAHNATVLDGETIQLGGVHYRLANISAPRVARDAHCWAEARLGRIARARLQELVHNIEGMALHGPPDGLAVTPAGPPDPDGRHPARVSLLRGEDLGDVLVSEGLAVDVSPAHPWTWCGPVTSDDAGAHLLADSDQPWFAGQDREAHGGRQINAMLRSVSLRAHRDENAQ
jgi:endonuclease YncB( thermonuclease family)